MENLINICSILEESLAINPKVDRWLKQLLKKFLKIIDQVWKISVNDNNINKFGIKFKKDWVKNFIPHYEELALYNETQKPSYEIEYRTLLSYDKWFDEIDKGLKNNTIGDSLPLRSDVSESKWQNKLDRRIRHCSNKAKNSFEFVNKAKQKENRSRSEADSHKISTWNLIAKRQKLFDENTNGDDTKTSVSEPNEPDYIKTFEKNMTKYRNLIEKYKKYFEEQEEPKHVLQLSSIQNKNLKADDLMDKVNFYNDRSVKIMKNVLFNVYNRRVTDFGVVPKFTNLNESVYKCELFQNIDPSIHSELPQLSCSDTDSKPEENSIELLQKVEKMVLELKVEGFELTQQISNNDKIQATFKNAELEKVINVELDSNSWTLRFIKKNLPSEFAKSLTFDEFIQLIKKEKQKYFSVQKNYLY